MTPLLPLLFGRKRPFFFFRDRSASGFRSRLLRRQTLILPQIFNTGALFFRFVGLFERKFPVFEKKFFSDQKNKNKPHIFLASIPENAEEPPHTHGSPDGAPSCKFILAPRGGFVKTASRLFTNYTILFTKTKQRLNIFASFRENFQKSNQR